MNFDGLKLENQICFPLYASSRAIVKMYKPLLDPIGLTYTQYVTLLALWEQDGIPVKQLGELLYLDSGTLTPLLKKLENQGILRRVRSREDERMVFVWLTPKGQELKLEAAEIPGKMACRVNLTEAEAKDLHRLLHKILANECMLNEE